MRTLARVLLAISLLALLLPACRGASSDSSACAAPQVSYSEEQALALDAQLLPYLQGQAGPFSINATDQEITSWITYWTLRAPQIPIKDAVVWFTPDQIHFGGTLRRVLPFRVRLTFHGRVSLEEQGPRVSLESACMGQSAMPGWARNLAQRVVNDTLADYRRQFHVDHLEIGQGEIAIQGSLAR